ncbi:MAG: MgtC/SapB family protein [Oscillospiraceae bacterium]|nr:MgtC/SapB family protein [Oscillospiraceae bacterium]
MIETVSNMLQEVNALSTVVRLVLALILGGALGVERGRKRRPAGLRTYMIVCMASALVMITGEFMLKTYGTGDPTRLGAQVISGIGFLGAGTIIITSRQVKGLTTAAGLWAAACMGLAVGAGFYVGAIVCGVLVLITMAAMSRLDIRLRRRSKQINFFAEFKSMDALGNFINIMRSEGYKLYDVEINRCRDTVSDLVGATFWVELNYYPTDHVEVIQKLSQVKGVRYLEEFETM